MGFVCKCVTADLRGEEMRLVRGRGGRGQGNNSANRKAQLNDKGHAEHCDIGIVTSATTHMF